MEDNRESIVRIAQRTGTTEQEALILYHLSRAHDLLLKLPGKSYADTTAIGLNINALYRMVAERVVRRDHPEGWGGDQQT